MLGKPNCSAAEATAECDTQGLLPPDSPVPNGSNDPSSHPTAPRAVDSCKGMSIGSALPREAGARRGAAFLLPRILILRDCAASWKGRRVSIRLHSICSFIYNAPRYHYRRNDNKGSTNEAKRRHQPCITHRTMHPRGQAHARIAPGACWRGSRR